MGKRGKPKQEAEEVPGGSVYDVLRRFYIPKFDAFGVSDLRLFEIPKQHQPQEYDNYEEWFCSLSNKMRSITLTLISKGVVREI